MSKLLKDTKQRILTCININVIIKFSLLKSSTFSNLANVNIDPALKFNLNASGSKFVEFRRSQSGGGYTVEAVYTPSVSGAKKYYMIIDNNGNFVPEKVNVTDFNARFPNNNEMRTSATSPNVTNIYYNNSGRHEGHFRMNLTSNTYVDLMITENELWFSKTENGVMTKAKVVASFDS